MNIIIKKLREGRRLFGTHIYTSDIRVTEIVGQLGFDYMWIDTEHAPLDYKTLETHLIAAKATGTPAIVRIPWNDPVLAKRVLEMGPDGIIFPMVNSVAEAQKAIDACLYPPLGTRGFGPQRAINYGLVSIDDYIATYTDKTCRLLQLESEASVECLEGMAAIPYVDGFVIGPMDMSGSVNDLSHFTTGRTDELINLAIKKAHACGKPIGLSTGSDAPDALAHWLKKDLDFISAGTDMDSIINSMRITLGNLREGDAKYRK